jgi:DNA-binding response OmpR family regulator
MSIVCRQGFGGKPRGSSTTTPPPSASDALRLCHYKQPDLMLLDLLLPDAPGLDVLREVRCADGATSKFDPELPVIVLSGRGSEHDRVRGLREGADDYVIKPTPSAIDRSPESKPVFERLLG